MFCLHVSTVIVCLIEIGCLRRVRSQMQVSKNGFDGIRELVNDRCTFEKTVTTLNGCRDTNLLNLGNTDKSPIETWKEHKSGHDDSDRTLHLSSR